MTSQYRFVFYHLIERKTNMSITCLYSRQNQGSLQKRTIFFLKKAPIRFQVLSTFIYLDWRCHHYSEGNLTKSLSSVMSKPPRGASPSSHFYISFFCSRLSRPALVIFNNILQSHSIHNTHSVSIWIHEFFLHMNNIISQNSFLAIEQQNNSPELWSFLLCFPLILNPSLSLVKMLYKYNYHSLGNDSSLTKCFCAIVIYLFFKMI